jgi:hypothetical protein
MDHKKPIQQQWAVPVTIKKHITARAYQFRKLGTLARIGATLQPGSKEI